MLDETLERYDLIDDEEEQVRRQRPRTSGLKGALALEREMQDELIDQLTLNQQHSIVINENREPWLDRSNKNLENLLAKENKDNDLLSRKVKHYAPKEKIALAKLKSGNAKIEELTMEEKKKLEILYEASLQPQTHHHYLFYKF